eukprot:1195728-Prorocentrum_minimum.AAC.10
MTYARMTCADSASLGAEFTVGSYRLGSYRLGSYRQRACAHTRIPQNIVDYDPATTCTRPVSECSSVGSFRTSKQYTAHGL